MTPYQHATITHILCERSIATAAAKHFGSIGDYSAALWFHDRLTHLAGWLTCYLEIIHAHR